MLVIGSDEAFLRLDQTAMSLGTIDSNDARLPDGAVTRLVFTAQRPYMSSSALRVLAA